ncbi:MAG: hypothetical protein EOP52_13990 [Sphingobacteriales bacterium]|nr:MAG: hypothetical protein EOP52_13990 [Sphingobacteriales bacterium]
MNESNMSCPSCAPSIFGRSLAAALLGLVFLAACGSVSQRNDQAEQRKEMAAKHERAISMWKARCEKSGEFIRQTASGVRGIYLINVRIDSNYDKQYDLDDPYGNDLVMGIFAPFSRIAMEGIMFLRVGKVLDMNLWKHVIPRTETFIATRGASSSHGKPTRAT